ncbi:MAG TPA: TrkA family potassium uptake protein [Chloroflexota bacterium]|nr:TrkA family potassium uptake protein [Chloroflexota bacterium]
MYAIVAGGGKVGYYLAKELVEQGHEVLVIERDSKQCAIIQEDLGDIVMQGDAAEASVLAEAGTARADVMVAVTGDDEDNLVICQVAKKRFRAPRTIARINNPKNEQIFRMLGIDATVSSTDVILGVLEQELPAHAVIPLLRLRHADVEVVKTVLDDQAPVVGRPLRDLSLPADCAIVLLVRGGTPIFPNPDTRLTAGDEVIAVTTTRSEARLRDVLWAGR